MKKPLSKAIKTFYGIGDLGFSLMTSVEIFYFVYFLTNVAKFSLPMVALIGSITSIVDAVLSPFYGAVITGTKTLKWGRNRSWILIGPPAVVVLYMFQYTKIGSETVAAAFICAGFIISHIVWNIGWVANVSLIPALANTPEERGLLASRRASYTAAAGIFFSYIGLAIATFFGKVTNNPILGFTILAGIMAFMMMLGYLIIFKITDGYEATGAEAAQSAAAAPGAGRVTFGDMFRNLAQNGPLIVLLLGDFFRYMALFVGLAAAAFYFTYVAQNMALFPTYLLIAAIAGTIGSYLSAGIIKKFSARTTAIYGILISAGLAIIAKFFVMDVKFLFIIMPFSGMFGAAAGAAMVGLYSDTAIYGEWKTGKNATPFVMGLMTLSLKIAIISRSTVIPIVLAAAGFISGANPATASVELKTAVINVYLFIPGIFNLICVAIVALGFKLTREKVVTYQSEIDGRRAVTPAQL